MSDASKVMVTTILYQVQDGVEWPITCASRQMNKVEQAYSASEAEMSALLWATNIFIATYTGNSS
jgi:hypothetical protein